MYIGARVLQCFFGACQFYFFEAIFSKYGHVLSAQLSHIEKFESEKIDLLRNGNKNRTRRLSAHVHHQYLYIAWVDTRDATRLAKRTGLNACKFFFCLITKCKDFFEI